MNLGENPGKRRAWAMGVAALLLMVASSFGVRHFAKTSRHNSHRTTPATNPSLPLAAAASASNTYLQVKSYFLDFAGDHSLTAATVTEQAAAGYANYTVELRLASGAEQSVVVAAPPGGLQIEMHDMTGDHVPNDVILRPTLPRWPPTVLVNDGHDHFAVVESGADPGCFSTRENLGSRQQNSQTFAYLRSSGFKAIHLPPSKRMLLPQLQQTSVSLFAQSFATGTDHVSSADRAPPFVTTI